MNKEQADAWFKQMGRMSPKLQFLPPDPERYGPLTLSTHTDFWENLYQAFKARMEAEQRESGVLAKEGQ